MPTQTDPSQRKARSPLAIAARYQQVATPASLHGSKDAPDGSGERRVGRGAGHAGKLGIHACGEHAALRQPECRRGERARVGALRDRECAQRQGIRLNYIYMYMQPDLHALKVDFVAVHVTRDHR